MFSIELYIRNEPIHTGDGLFIPFTYSRSGRYTTIKFHQIPSSFYSRLQKVKQVLTLHSALTQHPNANCFNSVNSVDSDRKQGSSQPKCITDYVHLFCRNCAKCLREMNQSRNFGFTCTFAIMTILVESFCSNQFQWELTR